MSASIDVTRVEVEEIREKFPNLYRLLKGKNVRATVTLISKKAHAQAYILNGGEKIHFYGSVALFERWLREEREAVR